MRGAKGNVEHVFVGDGDLTCKEMERRCIETAFSEDVPQTERNIVISEGELS
ncbi:MAG: hypothetical protein ACE5FA_08255 [Dehalococcoidia bacterium]